VKYNPECSNEILIDDEVKGNKYSNKLVRTNKIEPNEIIYTDNNIIAIGTNITYSVYPLSNEKIIYPPNIKDSHMLKQGVIVRHPITKEVYIKVKWLNKEIQYYSAKNLSEEMLNQPIKITPVGLYFLNTAKIIVYKNGYLHNNKFIPINQGFYTSVCKYCKKIEIDIHPSSENRRILVLLNNNFIELDEEYDDN
jgi:thioredoxin-related protein